MDVPELEEDAVFVPNDEFLWDITAELSNPDEVSMTLRYAGIPILSKTYSPTDGGEVWKAFAERDLLALNGLFNREVAEMFRALFKK